MQTFIYIFGQSKQDPLLTNTASAHLFSHLSKKTSIKNITVFSDGASSTYKASEAITALPSIASQFGIKIKAWNFFESQDGKNVADRMVALAKRKLEVYLNSGNDVVTAEDIKTGLDSNGGLKGTMVAVVKPNPRTRKSVPTIKNISNYTNFTYEADGVIRVHRAYAVGTGKMIEVKKSNYFGPVLPIEELGFQETDNSILTQYDPSSRNTTLQRHCPNEGCIGLITPGQEASHVCQTNPLSEEGLDGIDFYKVRWGKELLEEHSGLHGHPIQEVTFILKLRYSNLLIM